MPAKRSRGPPKAIPAGPDPVAEARIRLENLNKEIERKKQNKEKIEKELNLADKVLNEVQQDREQVINEKREVISDITREYKVQQNDFRKQSEELKAYADELTAKLAETQLKIRHTQDKFNRQKHQRDDMIQKNILKAEQMAQEFRDMLKGTLVKMSDRIEMSREAEEAQTPPQTGN